MNPKPPCNVDESRSIWLPGEVMSSKNSKMIGFYFLKPGDTSDWYRRTGEGEFKKCRPTLQNSSQAKAYIKDIAPAIIENRQRFLKLVKDLPKPYIIQLHFVRETKRAFDFGNMQQVIADAMCGHYWKDHPKIPHAATIWINDDNMNEVVFIPPLQEPFYSICPDCPGVWLTVLPREVKPQPIEQQELFKGTTEDFITKFNPVKPFETSWPPIIHPETIKE